MPYAAQQHQPCGRKGRKKRAYAEGKRADPFYSTSRWRKVRLMKLRREPLCVDPLGRHKHAGGGPVAATDVDHILPRLERPDLAYDLDNMRGLCKSCHSTVTARAMHARRRAGP